MSENWLNEDGLLVRFGPRKAESGSPAVENSRGALQTMIFEIGAGLDTPQDQRLDGDTRQVPLKEGDFIERVRVQVEEAFAGASTVDVGLETKDKTVIAADALAAAADLTTAYAVDVDSGSLVDAPVPDVDGPAYVTVAFDAPPTAGRARVLVDYLPRAGGLVRGEIGSGTGPSVDASA